MRNVHIFYVLVITILLIVIGIKSCDKDNTKDLSDYKYKTDTVQIDKDYQSQYNKLMKEYSKMKRMKETPPKTVKEYITKEIKGNVVKVPDSIIVYIDSTKKKTSIADNYIKSFVDKDKLINFKLVKDSFNLSTIAIDGKTITREYPLFLEKYDYYWYDNTLHHLPTKKKFSEKVKGKFNNMYINGGYDFMQKSPTIGAEYFIPLGKFKIGTDATLYIQQNPQINLNLKLGYRVF
jgi:hypothetical protein